MEKEFTLPLSPVKGLLKQGHGGNLKISREAADAIKIAAAEIVKIFGKEIAEYMTHTGRITVKKADVEYVTEQMRKRFVKA
jgi:histone H3/H4